MYIGPIQQTNTNSLNRVNFKKVTVEYCYDINNKEQKIINDKVKKTLNPIMSELEKIADGYYVKFRVTHKSQGGYCPSLGETPEPIKDIIKITIGDKRIMQLWPSCGHIPEPIKEFLFTKFGVKDPITSDCVIINQYYTDMRVIDGAGNWEVERNYVEKSTPKELRQKIVDKVKSMIEEHKQEVNSQLEMLNKNLILSDSMLAQNLRKLDTSDVPWLLSDNMFAKLLRKLMRMPF